MKHVNMATDRAVQSLGTSAAGTDPFADLNVPPPLEESLAKHRRHLAELVRTMKTAGISEEQIEESLVALVDLYKAELIAAIRRLKGNAW